MRLRWARIKTVTINSNAFDFYMGERMKKLIAILSIVLLRIAVSCDAEELESLQTRIERANSGDAQSQYELGFSYATGEGAGIDYEKALEWYTKSAEQNFGDALAGIALLYRNGRGVEENPTIAYESLKKGMALNSGACYYHMHQSYFYFERRPRDHPVRLGIISLEIFRDENVSPFDSVLPIETMYPALSKAAELGEPNAQYHLALSLYDSWAIENWPREDRYRIWEKAMQLLKDSADAGHIGALIELSTFYEDDKWTVARDYTKMRELLDIAAERGSARAMYRIGVMYKKGQGTKRDVRQAAFWMEKSALLGYSLAQRELALILRKNRKKFGLEDHSESFAWADVYSRKHNITGTFGRLNEIGRLKKRTSQDVKEKGWKRADELRALIGIPQRERFEYVGLEKYFRNQPPRVR